jgi:hypothetical protein
MLKKIRHSKNFLMVVVGWLVGLLIADGEGVQVHCDVIPLCHNCQLFLSRQ